MHTAVYFDFLDIDFYERIALRDNSDFGKLPEEKKELFAHNKTEKQFHKI